MFKFQKPEMLCQVKFTIPMCLPLSQHSDHGCINSSAPVHPGSSSTFGKMPNLHDRVYWQVQVLNRKIDRQNWQLNNKVLSPAARAQLQLDIQNIQAQIRRLIRSMPNHH